MSLLRIFPLLFAVVLPVVLFAAGGGSHGSDIVFPTPVSVYEAKEAHLAGDLGRELTLVEMLKSRIAQAPINLIATLLFFGAIAHTFMAGTFMKIAHKLEHEHREQRKDDSRKFVDNKSPVSIKATIFHFLGEVEAIFGIWVIPLLIIISLSPGLGWETMLHYVDTRNFTEPMFVVVIMAIASTRPVIQLAENAMSVLAGLGGRTPLAWWLSILTVGPLLGSFITEPAAMTICALLLGQQFYRYEPSRNFRYATLGLLFVNISVGGTLTHFAAPPVLMVVGPWGWDMMHMLTHFGWRAVIGIVVANAVYFMLFRSHFAALADKAKNMDSRDIHQPEPSPVWIMVVHLAFLAWTVITLHHPPMFIGGFLVFIAFTIATDHYQYSIQIKGPLLVGFFLAGLVTHGGLQGWWIAPVLGMLGEVPLFAGATILTAFNDNAAITFLASQVPAFSADEVLQYAVVAGAVTGGGLTVIANAPNPAGQSLLNRYFGENGISPVGLLSAAIFPTLVMAVVFIVIP